MRGDIVFVDLEVSSDPERREILDMGAIKENEGEFHKVSLSELGEYISDCRFIAGRQK